MLREFPEVNQSILSIAFDKYGDMLACGLAKGSVRLWKSYDPTEYDLDGEGDHAAAISVAVSPDGCAVVTGCKDGVVRLWDVKSRSLLRSFGGLPGPVTAVLFTPSSAGIVGCSKSIIRKWHTEGGSSPLDYIGSTEVLSIVLANDPTFINDSNIIVSGSKDGTVRIWSLEKGKIVKMTLGHNEEVRYMDFSPKKRMFATVSESGAKICELSIDYSYSS